jgi:hypothetical protein
MTRVSIVTGTEKLEKPKGYNSWLEYWISDTKTKKLVCGVSGCSNTKLVGAHVMKAEEHDNRNYITPVCIQCNTKTDEFDVHWILVPVPDNT